MANDQLPEKQQRILRKAIWVEWASIGYLILDIFVLVLVMGNSQAMKAAWAEDLLALIPPLSFLIAIRIGRIAASRSFPYGFHRATGVSHLISALALFAVGSLLFVESALGLVETEPPGIGTINVFGTTIWLGWLMIAVMVIGSVPPFILGRIKMRLAEQLHNRVLFADADMNKADWMTGVAATVGVFGIGIGWWWTDAAAALVISGSIIWDGIKNFRIAATGLMDARATTFDDSDPHPVTADVEEYLESLDWVDAAATRTRDLGQFFHVEAFVVPSDGNPASLEQLAAATAGCRDVDWKARDVVLSQVSDLPDTVTDRS